MGCVIDGNFFWGGGIDPKMLQKWVWLFIERIAELADNVVSIFLIVTCHCNDHQQIVFESRLGNHDVGNDCLMSIDRTNFLICRRVLPLRHINLQRSLRFTMSSA